MKALKHATLGYGTSTTLQLLTHLWTTYGVVDDDMLAANLVTIATPWAPPTPIETFISQITDCMAIAVEGGDPISEPIAVRTAIVIMEATGVFTVACRDWRAKATADRTLVNFYIHFRLADKNHKRETTTQAAGYHYAAQVQR